ncbi:hypothetical protein R3P38DRAFT_2860086 [Favolaschia claudopus]|uniref:Secreted protein n=1 Tax=Favolaschia claudopus TaxID=2862362 RepID=A0AAW0DL52_9AGAR
MGWNQTIVVCRLPFVFLCSSLALPYFLCFPSPLFLFFLYHNPGANHQTITCPPLCHNQRWSAFSFSLDLSCLHTTFSCTTDMTLYIHVLLLWLHH